jgi:hypothetical protein
VGSAAVFARLGTRGRGPMRCRGFRPLRRSKRLAPRPSHSSGAVTRGAHVVPRQQRPVVVRSRVAWQTRLTGVCMFAHRPMMPARDEPAMKFLAIQLASLPLGRSGLVVQGAQKVEFGCVYKVHTLGFGSGRTGVGSGRIPDVPGESSVCKGWNAVRVPPRA